MEKVVINSKMDKLNLYLNKYEASRPKANILLVHGMIEHKGRYEDICNFLNTKDYNVFIADNRGHGESLNDEIDIRGYFGNEKQDEAFLVDLKTIIEYIKINYKDLKLYVLAHSMGSIILRCYIKEHSLDIDKLILMGTPTYKIGTKFGIRVCQVLKKIKTEKGYSNVVSKLSTGVFNKSIKNPATDFDWISHNKENIEKYINDEECQFDFTISGFEALFKLCKTMSETKDAKYINKDLKIEFLVGKDDPVVGGKRGFKKSIKLVKKMGFNNISYKIYENKRHEILNELGYDVVYNDILNFFDN